MKKTVAILCLALMVVMTFSAVAFADGLEIVGVSPADGGKGLQPQNVAVKVKFSADMMDEAAIAANEKLFSIVDPEGKEIATTITYNEKKFPNELWILAGEDLASTTTYTFTAKAGIKAADGSALGSDFVSTFSTREVKKDSSISMILTVVMMGFMIVMTTRAAKNAKIKEDPVEAQKAALAKMNPYKISKAKGISLEEAKAEIAKEREKLHKLEAKAAEEAAKKKAKMEEEMRRYEAELAAQEEAERHANNFHVKKAGSLHAHGIETPKAIVKANKKKREAAAKAAKKAAKK